MKCDKIFIISTQKMLAITIRRPRNKGHIQNTVHKKKKKKEKSENTARVRIQKNLIMKSTFFNTHNDHSIPRTLPYLLLQIPISKPYFRIDRFDVAYCQLEFDVESCIYPDQRVCFPYATRRIQ